MKIIIILFFLFINSFALAEGNKDFNYKDYLLTGILKKQIFNQDNPDYFHFWEFRIFNNKIYLNFQGDMAGTEEPQPISDGIFELTTYKNSKIKIKVKNGTVIDFKLLSDKKDFIKKEKNIEKDFCKQGFFYSRYNELYFLYKNKAYVIENDKTGIEFINVNNNLFISFFDFHSGYQANKKEYKFKLVKDIEKNSNNYTKTRGNKYILKFTNKEYKVDIVVKNCKVINKKVLTI